MAIDMKSLSQRAFFVEEVENATESLERAREKFSASTRTAGISFEVVAPPEPDESWVQERLLHSLVYFCESEGTPIPKCPGVFVSLFVGNKLYCIAAAEVLRWAEEQFGLGAEELRERYGTHELETVLR